MEYLDVKQASRDEMMRRSLKPPEMFEILVSVEVLHNRPSCSS